MINRMCTTDKAAELINKGKLLLIAGDETLLKKLDDINTGEIKRTSWLLSPDKNQIWTDKSRYGLLVYNINIKGFITVIP